MPIVCDDPRSASLVTTAGLMSTQTTCTHAGSMLPTPMPCSIVDSTSTSPTPVERGGVAILRLDQVHHRVGKRTVVADAAGEDVVDVVRGCTRTSRRTVSTPCSTAGADAAGAVDRVDRAHVVAVAAFDGRAGFEIDAERRAEQRLLDVVHGERVAGEQHVDVARADQRRRSTAPPPVWTTTGPGDEGDALPPRFDRLASSRRCARRSTSTRRSDEISLVMNAKPMAIAVAELGR